MMTHHDPLNEVKSLFTLLQSEVKTLSTKSMLEHINNACVIIHKNGGQVAIAPIVSMLNSSGVKISKRTIYNKKDGPYRRLIDAWIKVSNKTTIKGSFKGNIKPENELQLITDDELKTISNHVLRYKLSLITGQIKGLQNQLNIARSLKEMPLLSATTTDPHQLAHQVQNNMRLNAYDIDVLKDFIKQSKSKKISFDEDESLVAAQAITRHEVLSQPGLKDIIERIIKSFTPPES